MGSNRFSTGLILEIPVFDPTLFGLSKTFYPLRTLKMINIQYTVLISRHGNID